MTELTPRYDEAVAFARQCHAGQLRKGTNIPYITHPLAVSALVLEHGGGEDAAVAGVLHDVVEDCGGLERLDEIRERFGDPVADIVDACTDSYQDPKPDWRERKEMYLARLQSAPPPVFLVAGCDKLHNLRCITNDYRSHGEGLWSRFRSGRLLTLWYYNRVVEILGSGAPASLVDELNRTLEGLMWLVKAHDPGPEQGSKSGIDNKTFQRIFLAAVEKANTENIDEPPLIPPEEWRRQIPKDLSVIKTKQQRDYPKPDRSNFSPNSSEDETDIGWAEGVLPNGRPFRLECWVAHDRTWNTYFFSSVGLEDFDNARFEDFLEAQGLLKWLGNQRSIEARAIKDGAGNPMWSVTVCVGENWEPVLIEDRVSLNPYPTPEGP